MAIDKYFTFTKKQETARLHAPKVCKVAKDYKDACEHCSSDIIKGTFVLCAEEVVSCSNGFGVRTIKTHRLCASCTADYIKATSVKTPEPTYAERQAQWVKENNVKAGTKVRVTRTFTEDEDGSCCWEHDDLVGKTGIIQNIYPHNLGINMNERNFRAVPYFALEVIKEPTYRPFKNAEEFKPYRDKWFVDNLNGRFKIDWHSDTHIYEYGNSFITWEEAFSKYKFEDGTPFGVKEEV